MNERPLCELHYATGAKEACPGADCAFWEADGCAFQRVSFHFDGRSEVARMLLGIRSELENASAVEPAPSRVQLLLPPGLRD